VGPELFDDDVFESWYCTDMLYFKAIQNNYKLWQLALATIEEDWKSNPFAKKVRWKCPLESNHIVFEICVHLHIDPSFPPSEPGHFKPATCKCSLVGEYFPIMKTSEVQKRNILDLMNALNRDHHPPYKNITRYLVDSTHFSLPSQ